MSQKTKRPRAKAAGRARGRSGGMVDAPGKRHRKPPPTERGVPHSSELGIAKARVAEDIRRRNRT